MAKAITSLCNYFTKKELALWSISVVFIMSFFLLFDGKSFLTLFASLIGVTSLILNAKGNPIGQILIVIFSLIYGTISYTCAYYGEMITYVGMSAPMAVLAVISWLKNPYEGNKMEVKVDKMRMKDFIVMIFLTVVVTWVFYFILKYFNTANIVLSTISVSTSFIAVFLTYKRSALFALGYAANDIVLIGLWASAAQTNSAYISVVVCFITFLINDIYGFMNWSNMRKRQERIDSFEQEKEAITYLS